MRDKLGRSCVLKLSAVWRIISITVLNLLISEATSLHYECIPSNMQEVSLGVANCSSQQLSHVPPNLPHNIRVLDLSNNQITELTDYSFVKYESLEILYLQNNSLSKLEPQVFERLRKVRYLDLSFNSLDKIPFQTFGDLKALLTLSLRGNRITSIPQNSFTDVSKLTSLYLSGNHIDSIHPKAFNGLNHLQQLELQSNALSFLNGTTFRFFSEELKEIKLYHNPWFCDCNLRWLIQWLKNRSDSENGNLRWRFNTEEPVCAGPSLVQQRPFSTLSTDAFICPIRMYSKARNLEVTKGQEVELFCKYMSDPYVDIKWLKNGAPIDPEKINKYKVETEGDLLITSRLHIYNFQYDDIAEYECVAENRLGKAFDSSLVTLTGVDPSNILVPKEATEEDNRDRVRNAIIASSTIGGVVFLVVIIALIVFLGTRCKRYVKKKKESIRMSFEEHLKANGIIEPNAKKEPQVYDEVPDGTLSIDDNMDDRDSVYDSLQRPRVPSSVNTNTYISFKTEFSEPDDMSTHVCSQSQQTNNNSKGSDGSQCESTSPLLENISPILIDPNDPFYEANLYVPRFFASTNNYLSSAKLQDYDDDNGFLSQKRSRDFIPYTDDHGFILPAYSVGNVPHRAATLPHNGHIVHHQPYIPHRTQTLPRGYSPHHMTEYGSTPAVRSYSVSNNHKSASVGNLGISPPKKPPRSFNSRDTVSLNSQNSFGDKENGLQLSLPKPPSEDSYGTAV